MPDPNPVVSNTTPLITLAEVGLLNVLMSLYGEIWIPEQVYDEYEAGQSRSPNRESLSRLPWISVHAVRLDPTVAATLDAGEAAAIQLARTFRARLVLLDERRGRRQAARLGLTIAGTLGVLLAGKERGLVPAVGPILDQLVAQGRWISIDLRRDVLGLAGESSTE